MKLAFGILCFVSAALSATALSQVNSKDADRSLIFTPPSTTASGCSGCSLEPQTSTTTGRRAPTSAPTNKPTPSPTTSPTQSPTDLPTESPTGSPTMTPIVGGHLLVCGRSDSAKCAPPQQALDHELHEVRCCSDNTANHPPSKNGWYWDHGDCGIWSGSQFGPTPDSCKHAETFQGATDFCASVGGRLCTQQELENDCTINTGCGHDADMVWSSTPWSPQVCETCGESEACGLVDNEWKCVCGTLYNAREKVTMMQQTTSSFLIVVGHKRNYFKNLLDKIMEIDSKINKVSKKLFDVTDKYSTFDMFYSKFEKSIESIPYVGKVMGFIKDKMDTVFETIENPVMDFVLPEDYTVPTAADSSDYFTMDGFASTISAINAVDEKTGNHLGKKREKMLHAWDKTKKIKETLDVIINATEFLDDRLVEAQLALGPLISVDNTMDCCISNKLTDYIIELEAFWLDISPFFDAFDVAFGWELMGLPDFPFDLGFLDFWEDIALYFGKIEDWLNDLLNPFKDFWAVNKCCTGTGMKLTAITEIVSDTINLATCWTGPLLDGSIGQAFDVALDKALGPLEEGVEDLVNPVIQDMNSILETVGSAVPTIQYPSGIDFSAPQFTECSMDTAPVVGLAFSNLDLFSFDLWDEFDIDFGGDGVSFSDIGNQITSECGSAWEDLTTIDAQKQQCCDTARFSAYDEDEFIEDGGSCDPLASYKCWSGRCDLDGTKGYVCKPLSPISGDCDEHTDCEFLCKGPVGTGDRHCTNANLKLENGARCFSSGTCESGRCDANGNGKKVCKAQLEIGGTCSEHSDCLSGRCSGTEIDHGVCSEPCQSHSDCETDEFCGETLWKKMCKPKRDYGGLCDRDVQCKGVCSGVMCVDCDSPGTSSGCGSGNYCNLASKCKPKKANEANCGFGYECGSGACSDVIAGKCKDACADDSDCPSEEFCGYNTQDKFCKPQKGNDSVCDRSRQCKNHCKNLQCHDCYNDYTKGTAGGCDSDEYCNGLLQCKSLKSKGTGCGGDHECSSGNCGFVCKGSPIPNCWSRCK